MNTDKLHRLTKILVELKTSDSIGNPSHFLELCLNAVDELAQHVPLPAEAAEKVSRARMIDASRVSGLETRSKVICMDALVAVLNLMPETRERAQELEAKQPFGSMYLETIRNGVALLAQALHLNIVRLSVASLTNTATVTGARTLFAILNRSSLKKKGVLVYKAVGGASELTLTGKHYVQIHFGAVPEEDNNDARLLLPEMMVDALMARFMERDTSFAEISPKREMTEEFTRAELVGQTSALLTHARVKEIVSTFRRSVIQTPETKGDLSSARSGDIPTYRVLHLFDLCMSSQILAELTNCQSIKGAPIFRQLTRAEVKAGHTTDGIQIGGNVFLAD